MEEVKEEVSTAVNNINNNNINGVLDIKGRKYITKELYEYINGIWDNYNIEIPNDSNIMFAKNTTVHRLITDYSDKNINRVRKKEKCNYFIVNAFYLSTSSHYYNEEFDIVSNNKEYNFQDIHVYPIYNNSVEIQEIIELIAWFRANNPEIKYVNQDRLNDSLNNGFIINEENYDMLSQLINSNDKANHILAADMVKGGSLKDNIEWVMYLYRNQFEKLKDHDPRKVIVNYISSTYKGWIDDYFNPRCTDKVLSVVKNPSVKKMFLSKINEEFNNNIEAYLKNLTGSTNFKLSDFKLDYIDPV